MVVVPFDMWEYLLPSLILILCAPVNANGRSIDECTEKSHEEIPE
jgi:hypothetical protein